MIHVIVGHRGAGKTSFLARVDGYARERGRACVTEDLDRRVEERSGLGIPRIFADQGEAAFREWERRIFLEFVSEHRASRDPVCLSVGAGFSGELPEGCAAVWLRRPTDPVGRIFLDRPRLNEGVSPWEEYHELFAARESRYAGVAQRIWTVLEGWDAPNDFERDFVLSSFFGDAGAKSPRGILTVLSDTGARAWIRERLRWQRLAFELRDDLLSGETIESLRQAVPADRIIRSFRKGPPEPSEIDRLCRDGIRWDFSLELGAPPANASILSLHRRASGESVACCAARLESAARDGAVLKLAIEIRDFDELLYGAEWASREPKRRAFLPRSTATNPGRWQWFRVWSHLASPLPFIREGEGSAPDQPYWVEALQRQAVDGAGRFAAILGDPVLHSLTPAEHFGFFAAKGIPVLRIPVGESEWERALEVLTRLGLRFAAVTSPLKEKAARSCAGSGAVNTLLFDETARAWRGINTDRGGLEALLALEPSRAETAVWGGGGTLAVLQGALPHARFFSARTGHAGADAGSAGFAPRTVIWAVGRTRMSEARWPDGRWRPEVVLDLNYGEDSPGREYALRAKARYVSGIAMFREQARLQREFWQEGMR